MKVFNVIFLILFIGFAALQYNDPDPYIWIPIYLYASYLCWLAMKNRYPGRLYLLGFAVFGIYAGYLFFNETGVLSWIFKHGAENIAGSMKAEKPWIEETREFFGLVIVMIVMCINLYNNRPPHKE